MNKTLVGAGSTQIRILKVYQKDGKTMCLCEDGKEREMPPSFSPTPPKEEKKGNERKGKETSIATSNA